MDIIKPSGQSNEAAAKAEGRYFPKRHAQNWGEKYTPGSNKNNDNKTKPSPARNWLCMQTADIRDIKHPFVCPSSQSRHTQV